MNLDIISLNNLRDLFISLLLLIEIPFLLLIMYKIARVGNDEIEKIKQDYEYQLKLREKRIEELEKYIELLKRSHKEEIQMYMKTERMAIELKNAVTNGAVKLRCPEHPDAEIQVLADGTIVCSKGHRLWPREPK